MDEIIKEIKEKGMMVGSCQTNFMVLFCVLVSPVYYLSEAFKANLKRFRSACLLPQRSIQGRLEVF